MEEGAIYQEKDTAQEQQVEGKQQGWRCPVCPCACLMWSLCDPMDCRPTGPSVHEIFRARILEWVAISYSARYLDAKQVGEYPDDRWSFRHGAQGRCLEFINIQSETRAVKLEELS